MAENIDLQNEELQNALQIIQYTHRSLFLTGKAGTGKSTFLRYIAANTKKKHVVLAPTGIAPGSRFYHHIFPVFCSYIDSTVFVVVKSDDGS